MIETAERVRVARVTDIPAIVSMGCRFHAATAYAHIAPMNETDVRQQLLAMVRSTNGDVVFVAEREGRLIGMLGAIITAPWTNRSFRVMLELFWWVDPASRKECAGAALLDEMERWWPKHANGLIMLATPNIEPEKMARLYRMKGFAPFDSYFAKWKKE